MRRGEDRTIDKKVFEGLTTSFIRSEKKILATIAQIGLPQTTSPRRPKSLRAAALTVMFILRARYV